MNMIMYIILCLFGMCVYMNVYIYIYVCLPKYAIEIKKNCVINTFFQMTCVRKSTSTVIANQL